MTERRYQRAPSIRISNSGQSFAFSRHVLPELCSALHPLKKEGAGKAGRRLAPAVRGKEMHTGGPQVEPEQPGLPCAMVYDLLRALLGETSSIAPVALRMFCGVSHRLVRAASAGLDASFGRQDHTTSPSAHTFAGFSTAGVCSPSRPCEDAVSAVSSHESPCSRSTREGFPPCQRFYRARRRRVHRTPARGS
jgi:hypothetical protein